MSANEANLSAQELQDQKDVKKFKVLYPLSEFLAGIQKQFFGVYLNFFYTNVYMFSVTFTAAMTMISNIVSWVVTPVFSAFIDRFKFKKAKFWPWLIFGTVIVYGIQVLITALPAMTGKTTQLATFVFKTQPRCLLYHTHDIPCNHSFVLQQDELHSFHSSVRLFQLLYGNA